MWERVLLLVVAATVAGCTTHEVSGGALILNAQPAVPPQFAGAYDFDLMPATNYTACVKRSSPLDGGEQRWVLGVAFDKMPGDALTRAAIAAAASHIIDLTEADTLIVTHLATQAKSNDEVCATVFARGVVLKKAVRSGDEMVDPTMQRDRSAPSRPDGRASPPTTD